MNKALMLVIITLLLFAFQQTSHARPSRYGLSFCGHPDFQCITIKRGQSWRGLWPDEYQQQIIRRLNRMNTPLRSGMRIAVPRNLAQTDLLDISPFPHTMEAPGEKMIVVDLPTLAWGAYDPYGNLVHWGPISGGKGYCSDVGSKCETISGHFRVYRKKGSECKSKTFPLPNGGAEMPYCMFFHAGFALHASKVVPGYHASHGCVRIFAEDAKWLNEDFIDLPGEPVDGTRVIVNPYT